jgi:hypothetical protein
VLWLLSSEELVNQPTRPAATASDLHSTLTELFCDRSNTRHLELVVLGIGGMLLEILHEILQLSPGLVLDWLLVVAWEEVDGGESLHVQAWDLDLVGGGVHLGDHDIVVGAEFGSQLIPSWCELLAVSTPRSVELDKDILLVVEDNICERRGETIDTDWSWGAYH